MLLVFCTPEKWHIHKVTLHPLFPDRNGDPNLAFQVSKTEGQQATNSVRL